MKTAEDRPGTSRALTKTALREVVGGYVAKMGKLIVALGKRVRALEAETRKAREDARAAAQAAESIRDEVRGMLTEHTAMIRNDVSAVHRQVVENKPRSPWPAAFALAALIGAASVIVVVMNSASGVRTAAAFENGIASLKRDIQAMVAAHDAETDKRIKASEAFIIDAVETSKGELAAKIDGVAEKAAAIDARNTALAETSAFILERLKKSASAQASPESAAKPAAQAPPQPPSQPANEVTEEVVSETPAPAGAGRVFADADRMTGKKQEFVYEAGDTITPRWFSKRAVEQGRVIVPDTEGVYVSMDFSPWFASRPIVSEPVERHISIVMIDGEPRRAINLPEDVRKVQFWLPKPRADGRPLRVIYVK